MHKGAVPIFYLAVAALLALGVLGIGGGVLGAPQSIVSISNVNWDDGSQSIRVAQTTASGDTTFFVKAQNFSVADKTVWMKSSVKTQVIPKQPFCQYALTAVQESLGGVFGIGSFPITYYNLQAPATHSPYRVIGKKADLNGFATYDVGFVDGDVSLSVPVTQKIVDPLNPKAFVSVTTQGSLGFGGSCPSESGAVLLPVFEKKSGTLGIFVSDYQIISWVLKDKTSWQIQRNNIKSFNFIGLEPISIPANFPLCPSWGQCNNGVNNTATAADSKSLVHLLPWGSVNTLITQDISKEFADVVIVQKANVVPSLSVSWQLNKNTVTQGESILLDAKIKNIGTTDGAIQLVPSSTLANVYPNGTMPYLTAGQEQIYTFKFTGFSTRGSASASDWACVDAYGSDGKTAHQCLTFIVNAPIVTPAPWDALLGITPSPSPLATPCANCNVLPTEPTIKPSVTPAFKVKCPDGRMVDFEAQCNLNTGAFKLEDWMIALGALLIAGLGLYAFGGKRR